MRVHKYDPATRTEVTVNFDEEVSLIIPVKDTADKFVVTQRRKVVLMTWDGESSKPGALEVIATVDEGDGKQDNRINDGKADSAGTLWAGNRRTVFNFEEQGVEGFPDGQTIDTEGKLWVACYGGKQVIQVDPASGKLLQRVDIPALNVTSVAWGGAGLDELFVTSAFDGMTREELERLPMAGCSFRVTGLGAKGLPAHRVLL
ncbi:regucalcin-like isoform X2 [Schistocerca gregaria]|nr:regucalcin-like isoform X2 [Schistocerca gregaria]